MHEDMALLRDYAARRSEAAFAAIVSRHVALVHSAALRQTGDAHLAEEITQAVFIILARKAGSLGEGTILSAWLYRATRYTACDALKARRRRAEREQQAYMQSTLNEPQAGVWDQLAPLLDEAMAGLGERDRSVLVMRYFENKTAPQIAVALNLNEDAAQKRVARALEKLRTIFVKRGVSSTTAIIAGLIAANSVHAAPVALAKTVTAAAIANGATASGSTLTLIKGALKIMAWTKLKTTVVVGVAVLFTAGTTTIAVRQISLNREDPVWTQITAVDSRQLEVAPPTVSVRLSKYDNPMMGGSVWSSNGKRMGLRASAAALLSSAYDISVNRIVDPEALPTGKYDFIVSLPDHQSGALQAEIKKKLGLVAEKQMRERGVLLLKVARRDAPGLKAESGPNPNGGSGSRSSSGQFTCDNQPISTLRSFLEGRMKTIVIDQTGLNDRYDIDLKWSESGGYQNPDLEALKQALLDQLGLELKPATQSIEMLVVKKAN